jgi:hypothetical protein
VKNERNAVPDSDLETQSRLTGTGENALYALLDLLGLPHDKPDFIKERIFFKGQSPRNTGTEVIRSVIFRNGSVKSNPLRNFIAGLVEAVADNYIYQPDMENSSLNYEEKYAPMCANINETRLLEVNKVLIKYELISYYNLYIEKENIDQNIMKKRRKAWTLPTNLCEPAIDTKKLHANIKKHLYYLDYQDQIDDFEANYKTHSIFLVEAPKRALQQWLASRLVELINGRRKNRARICYIYEDNKDYKYPEFLDELFKGICSLGCSDINVKLSPLSEPVILVIHGFRDSLLIQQEFFKDLSIVFANNSLKYKPKILWIDESPPYFYQKEQEEWQRVIKRKLISLRRLDEINETHVRNWYTSQNLDGREFSNLVTDIVEWQEPATILERICNRLGMDGNINEIEKQLWSFK